MCGIFAHIGQRNSAEICLEGLKSLEYRGYDSAGIAGINEGKLVACKQPGKVAMLENVMISKPLCLDLAIGHTRWATHGKPNQINAHPHFDQSENIAIVHNGIIENHFSIREKLQAKGYEFYTDTDTEVLVQLIAYHYQGDLLEAVQKCTEEVEGFWAFVAIHKDEPHRIIAAARDNPLVIGMKPDRSETFVSSDVQALRREDLEIIVLERDEIAAIYIDHIDVYDHSHKRVERIPERLGMLTNTLSKEGYEHYMLKEIFEQPKQLQKIIDQFSNNDQTFDQLCLNGIEKITILACGSSWHAAALGALFIEDLARIPARAEIASEFRYRKPLIDDKTLVIAISQSGETLETLLALRYAKQLGAKTLALCNVPLSTLTREADQVIYLEAGAEISVCSTKTYSAQLLILYFIAMQLAEQKINPQELEELPIKIHQALALNSHIEAIARKYSSYNDFIFLGRFLMVPSCLEGALKLKEIAYVNAFGCPAGEMKHGTIALITPELVTIALCGNRKTAEKIKSNLMEIKARGGSIIIFTTVHDPIFEKLGDEVITLPEISDELAPIIFAVATHLFAYYSAKVRGCEIDQPRNLAKSVTVE